MSLITTLGECRDGHIFKGEHYILFSYDLGWLWYCAGWRQSPLLAELHVIGISCHFWDAGPVTWVLNPAGQPGFSACFGWETVKSFFPSCTPRVSAFAGTSLTALSTGILLVPLRSEQTWLSQSELSVLEGPQLSEFLLHPWQCPFCMLMWAQVVSSLWPWERYSAPLY